MTSLAREWAAARERIGPLLHKYHDGGRGSQTAYKDAQALFLGFLERLKNFRVLDPACGSGNFLYLSLRALKDLEHRANLDAEALGLHRQLTIETSPANVLGIEINSYAAELARVTVWIGEIQWMLKNGYDCRRNPILATLDHIENRDALLDADGSEAEWPAVDVIVENPPFLGDKMMRGELGDASVERLRKCYSGRVPGGADLVTYWFEKSRAQIEAGQCQRAGLVATNSIRGGASRKVLDRIVDTARIFEAWSDEAWVNEGAAVRVSLVCFAAQTLARHSGEGRNPGAEPLTALDSGLRRNDGRLDGQTVSAIHADLTAGVDLDVTRAEALPENRRASFIGGMKKGAFDIPGETARAWLGVGGNPNGRSNTDVLCPWINGLDITRRPMDAWIVDFGVDRPLAEASCYQTPFEHVLKQVKPARDEVRNPLERDRWWLHARPAPGLRLAIQNLHRFIGTARVAKHRLFVWIKPPMICDGQVVVIARSDGTTFGILHSRFHELWSLRLGTSLEDRPRYTPTTCFETFPFPAGLTPRDTASSLPPLQGEGRGGDGGETEASAIKPHPHPNLPLVPQGDFLRGKGEGVKARIAAAAKRLNELRENWLNPAEWVDWVITPEEEKAGFPKRPVAKPGHEAELKKRTLTNLYNARPAWLDLAHKELDQAVAAAYGWGDYTPELPDEEILRRLLALNLARSS